MLVVCQTGCIDIVHWWKVWNPFIVYPFLKTVTSFGDGNSLLHNQPCVSVLQQGRTPWLMVVIAISGVNHLSCAMRELDVIVRHVSPVFEDL
jgi:hypothetical protein